MIRLIYTLLMSALAVFVCYSYFYHPDNTGNILR